MIYRVFSKVSVPCLKRPVRNLFLKIPYDTSDQWPGEYHRKINIKQRVSHTMALPFTLKSTLRQKKNYGNSNISPCQKFNLLKIL
jgi:hypothetical protein